jgi:UDP-N-acetylmuramoyl-tripeptide--D-alanyl-D-alanine ligase
MLQLTAKDVESSTRGSLARGSGGTRISGVSIDTRSLKDGDLFFAIRGPNQDGHRFIPDALSRGASGVVAERGYQYPGEFPSGRILLMVENTHEALKDIAMSVRRQWPGELVAVTGSMGKTTTKEFAAQVLQSRFSVYRTPGNYNNLFGLPLALLGLETGHDIGIFEMGMSTHGEIAEMCRIAAPSVGILINIAPVHLAFFDSIEDIAQSKGELVEALPPTGTLIFNADDGLVRRIAARFAGSKISFGLSEGADIRAERIQITGLEETRFRLLCAGRVHEAMMPFAGAHYVMNALAGVALGTRFSVEPERMIESLATLQQPAMRGQIVRFKEGFTVIDDSYNSNPRALMQMIEVLSGMPSFARRILVAGEMLELGKESAALHFECGSFAANRKLDIVLGIRGDAREIVRGAVESGLQASQAHFFPDSDAATAFVAGQLREQDLALVKGSRGVHMEKIVRGLRARFEAIDA